MTLSLTTRARRDDGFTFPEVIIAAGIIGAIAAALATFLYSISAYQERAQRADIAAEVTAREVESLSARPWSELCGTADSNETVQNLPLRVETAVTWRSADGNPVVCGDTKDSTLKAVTVTVSYADATSTGTATSEVTFLQSADTRRSS